MTEETQNNQRPKIKLKIVMLGSSTVGKTSMVLRYMNDEFSEDLDRTIGCSFLTKQWGSDYAAIWDTAGQDKFAGLSSVYCAGARAAILAYDLTKEETFEDIHNKFLDMLPEEKCLKVVVGTKLDLIRESADRPISIKEAREFATEINQQELDANANMRTPYFETSSKSKEGITEVFDFILKHCLGSKHKKEYMQQSNEQQKTVKRCCIIL